MFKNGEFEIVVAMFENKHLQASLPYTGGLLNDKAPRSEWKNKNLYNNGALNAQFQAFLAGYSAGKSIALAE